MEYKGKTYSTMGDIFNDAVRLAKTDVKEAHNLFNAYVQHIYDNAADLASLVMSERWEAAVSRAKSNFGYFAGYYDKETCDLVYSTFQCSHTIFGGNPFNR